MMVSIRDGQSDILIKLRKNQLKATLKNSDSGSTDHSIISKLPMKRALEIIGGRNMVIKSKVYGRRTQQFVFDIKSKTVKSVAYMDRSLDIANAGRSSNL
jgi:hypothetical protein